MALACFGLANKAEAGPCRPGGAQCNDNRQCCSGSCFFWPFPGKNNAAKFGTCTY
jgi:hypothetical protein